MAHGAIWPIHAPVSYVFKFHVICKIRVHSDMRQFYHRILIISTEGILYLHGEAVGDIRISAADADVNSPFIVPPMGFPFLDSVWDRLYVSRKNT